MRKVFLDDLPRWGKGGKAKEGSINWSASVGLKIPFVYNEVVGKVEIIENINSDYLKVKYKDNSIDINKESFKKCKFGKLLKLITNEFKVKVGDEIKNKDGSLVVLEREYRECKADSNKNGVIYKKTEKWYRYKCNRCYYQGWKIESVLLNNSGCPCCTNQIAVEGVNDIPTTNPELVKYFKGGYEVAKLYTKGSGRKAEVFCESCKNTRFITVSTLKENLVCEECRGVAISQNRQQIKLEDSFKMNDKYNRLRYWDYDKNTKLPHEIHKGSLDEVWFLCENNNSFKTKLSYVNSKRATWCPHCANLLNESKMASVLKQVIKKEFQNTIWEYNIGFKGDKGGTSNYDIYIPELNLIIECQSEYHDNKSDFDRMKKEFAIKSGYEYLDIDYREFDLLQAIQLFFPHTKQVPDYVIHTKNVRIDWNIEKAQQLLNDTDLTQKEVAEAVGADVRSFYDKVFRNVLEVPLNKRNSVSVVQLDFEGNFIRKHKKASEFKQYGFNTPDICSCCKKKQKTHRGYIFIYEDEYENTKNKDGGINLKKDYKKISKNANKKKVLQISKEGKIVAKFKSITEAGESTGFLVSNISACCNGKSKTSNGYVWRFEEDFEFEDKT